MKNFEIIESHLSNHGISYLLLSASSFSLYSAYKHKQKQVLIPEEEEFPVAEQEEDGAAPNLRGNLILEQEEDDAYFYQKQNAAVDKPKQNAPDSVDQGQSNDSNPDRVFKLFTGLGLAALAYSHITQGQSR